MKKNKKIITLIITGLMILVSFSMLYNLNVKTNNINVVNYTTNAYSFTIDNSNSIPTSNPLYYSVNISKSDLAGSFSNLTNVYFEYSNGTLIPSWFYINTTLYGSWYLKLFSIPASTIITIDVEVNTSFVLSILRNIGEAPQLSNIRGAYDNGNKFFGNGNYYNFSNYASLNNLITQDTLTYSSSYGLKLNSTNIGVDAYLILPQSNVLYNTLVSMRMTDTTSNTLGSFVGYSNLYGATVQGLTSYINNSIYYNYYTGTANIPTYIGGNSTYNNTVLYNYKSNTSQQIILNGVSYNFSLSLPINSNYYGTGGNTFSFTANGHIQYMNYLVEIPKEYTYISYNYNNNNLIQNFNGKYIDKNYTLPYYNTMKSYMYSSSQDLPPTYIYNKYEKGFLYFNTTDLLFYNITDNKISVLHSWLPLYQYSPIYRQVIAFSNYNEVLGIGLISSDGYLYMQSYNFSTKVYSEINTSLSGFNPAEGTYNYLPNYVLLSYSTAGETYLLWNLTTNTSYSFTSTFGMEGENGYYLGNNLFAENSQGTDSLANFNPLNKTFYNIIQFYSNSAYPSSNGVVLIGSNEFAIVNYADFEQINILLIVTRTGTIVKEYYISNYNIAQQDNGQIVNSSTILLNNAGTGYGKLPSKNEIQQNSTLFSYALLNISSGIVTPIYLSNLTTGSTSPNFVSAGSLGTQYASNNGYGYFTNDYNNMNIYIATSGTGFINYLVPNTNTLTIKENGLSNINFTYTLNGTTYTQTTQEKNYTFPNGNYSLSVNAITGYIVNYPTTITVNNNNVIAYVNFTKQPVYNLTLKENGLLLGTSFTYTFNGNTYTLTNNSYKYLLINGTYSLSVNNINGYNVIYPSTITIVGKNQTDYINFSKIPTYTLFVKETGLINGTTYHIFVNTNEYTSVNEYNNVTGLTNGTYTFSVDTISDYLLSSYPTSFTINGANQTIDLTFTKNASTYNVNIIENGLANPVNIKWSVVFNNTEYVSSNSNSITIGGILNGSYSFKVNPIANYITDKYNTTLIVKGNTTYNIYFNETFKFILRGLNINVFWAITFNSNAIDEVNNYVNLTLVNQTFSLKIITPTGYSVTPYPNSIIINGKNVYLNVTFSKILITAGHYIVTFYIEGYNGNWSLTINGEQYYSNHVYLNITLTNGSYTPLVQLPANYQLQPLQPLVVNGNNTVYVIYAKAYFNWVYYEPYIAIIILILGVLIIPAVVRRR